MQLKKEFSFTNHELSHAQWAIETGNFDTELAKSIQRKLLGHLVGTPNDDVALAPIVATDLMEIHLVRFSLGIVESGESECMQQPVNVVDNFAFSCDFVIAAEEVAELDHLDTDDLANSDMFKDWMERRKKAEIMKHCDDMWRLCQYEGVDSFDEVNTDAVDLDDGSIHVTFDVIPVYKIH